MSVQQAPTRRPPALPLAPRPYPDEALSSWVKRIASRYDFGGDDLVRHVLGHGSFSLVRLGRLDACTDPELETALADAGQIDLRRVRDLRIVCGDGAAWPWHRVRSAWCPACVESDLARDDEVYERASWRLGCSVECPVHALPLEDRCDRCWEQGHCRPRPSHGRSRLVCDVCRQEVDPALGGSYCSFRTETRLAAELCWTPELDALVRRMQDDLLAALAGRTPARHWAGICSAKGLIRVVRDLAETLVSATGPKVESLLAWRQELQSEGRYVAEPITPAALGVVESRTVLAIVAAALDGVCGGVGTGARWYWDGVAGELSLKALVDVIPELVTLLLWVRSESWEQPARAALEATGLKHRCARAGLVHNPLAFQCHSARGY